MKNILTFLLLLVGLSISAQITITGKIIDKKTQAPIDFAEIVLTNEDIQSPIGTISNELGVFSVEASSDKSYLLQIIYIGQVLHEQQISSDKNVDLGTIEVENSVVLDEVTVSATKKLIERKIDRLVFNIENSSKATQGDALEVLRVTPGVMVQNNNITMIGKGGVAVMIDDKVLQLAGDELTNYLKTLSSEDIQSVEVITTPPAKYEAAGNSGLINIKLKQAKKDSWNAQLNSYARKNRFMTNSAGGSYNFNKNKFSIASSVNYRKGTFYQEQDDYAYFPDGVWYTSSPFESKTTGLNGRLDLNYEINPNWSMGAQYLYNGTDYDVSDAPFTPVTSNETGELLRELKSEGTNDLNPVMNSANFNNIINLDTLGRSMEVNLDYFNYSNPDTKLYNGTSVIYEPSSTQYFRGTNANFQDVTNLSAKVDFEYPTSWANLSFGGKVASSKSLNDIEFFNSGLVDEAVTDLPLSKNDFEFNEIINSAYISANKAFNDKWSGQFGLRVEATQTNSISDNLAIDIDNDYTKLFPTLYLSYNATENSNFAFNYSRRIQRPSFFQLNPNIYFLNPFQTIEGNAFLLPSFVDNFELSNYYKGFSTKIFFTIEDEVFDQVPLPNSMTNVIRFTNENYLDIKRFGFSENYYYDASSWWSSSNGINVVYSIAKFDLEEEHDDLKGFVASAYTYNDFTLNKDRTLLLGVFGWGVLPGVRGIFETKSAGAVGMSFQYYMLDRNLNFTFRANDIFKTAADRTETTVNGVFQTARYYYDNRSFQLSISYKFGNNEISAKKHETGNQDEKGRIGN